MIELEIADAPPRAPTVLQPRPKAAATLNASPKTTVAPAPPLPRVAVRTAPVSDATSDKAIASLIRRTLCSHLPHISDEKGRISTRPIEELLPPLTSSNDVDLQLYGFIAIIMREFVYAWYGKITPDHLFVEEIIKIIAHCTRALEQRLRKVDLESLLLDELPELVEAHIAASDPRETYHTLHPHPALSPVPLPSSPDVITGQRKNEAAYRRLLVQGVLAVLLPTEDLENGCLRALVGEILAEMVLGNGVGGRVCEGWVLWESITKVADSLRGEITGLGGPDDQREGPIESHPPISTESAIIRSHAIHGGSVTDFFWRVLQYGYMAFSVLRFLAVEFATTLSSLPRSRDPSHPSSCRAVELSQSPLITAGTPPKSPTGKRPILSMKIWSCVSRLLSLNVIMPWLKGMIALIQWGAISGPGRVGDTDGILDRFLSCAFHMHVLQKPALLTSSLRLARTSLFPSNSSPPPPRPMPDPLEMAEIKQRCTRSILALIPAPITQSYLRSDSEKELEGAVAEILEIFGDAYCNKHLIYGIVDLVVLRLMPELADERPSVLLKRRIGDEG
ncbi:hypothetical protein FGG08_004186 [Glutinoglossum americanum]|uniref:PXA domain-containing protein n=1 Tax=Glutinoglossum americanum TaxID=1670608 RepID=A0A9P8I0Z6_9PEZI|nr:hypothetical protein FGG08_004186 [Glutinoglossum americanum]